MNWALFKREVRHLLTQIGLAAKQTAQLVVDACTLNVRGYDDRCEAEVDAFIAKWDAERP